MALPKRRLVEADFSPGGGKAGASADPYNRVFTLQVLLRLLGLVVQGAME